MSSGDAEEEEKKDEAKVCAAVALAGEAGVGATVAGVSGEAETSPEVPARGEVSGGGDLDSPLDFPGERRRLVRSDQAALSERLAAERRGDTAERKGAAGEVGDTTSGIA